MGRPSTANPKRNSKVVSWHRIPLSLLCLCAILLLSGCLRLKNADTSSFAPSDKNRLVIYTSHQEGIYAPLIREFEDRTGIWVQVVTGGTTELLERIASEGEDTSCDLMFGGGVESLEARRELFSPYQSSLTDSVSPSFLSSDGQWTPFSTLPIILVYNPKLVRTNPPSGWEDLLDPVWHGEIAFANPSLSGSGYTALATLLQILPGETDELLCAFAKNLDGKQLDRSVDVIRQVANGNFYIGITVEDDALRGMEDGYDIAIVYPQEGTSTVCDGMAIIRGCAHEENARRFIDFALSEDAQRYLTEVCSRHSVRADLAPLDSEDDAGFTLFPYDIAWASKMQKELLARWNELTEEVRP